MYEKTDTMNLTDCRFCKKTECIHKDCFRRLSVLDGGLGLCENLLCKGKYMGEYIVSYTLVINDNEYKYERKAFADTENQVKDMLKVRHKKGYIRIDKIEQIKDNSQP